ncbi:phosphopantothenoylcysteine decarboxylase domain-containing protein, partial [Staphylococcus epidermidis]|uniref:phosphopantothenoylcysteine decarboxylase domain-containing protein n=1 Tax=Staphylococcus epidermidis TaxID=1282 RepID=UPI0037D9911E
PPTHLSLPQPINLLKLHTPHHIFQPVTQPFPKQHILIKPPAVSHYTPIHILQHKLKKQQPRLSLQFNPTNHILKYLPQNKTHQ